MSDYRVHSGRIVFNPEDIERRFTYPNPEAENFANARHELRYGTHPNFEAATLADSYAYLVSVCPTTEDAIEALRQVRRAVRELRQRGEGSG